MDAVEVRDVQSVEEMRRIVAERREAVEQARADLDRLVKGYAGEVSGVRWSNVGTLESLRVDAYAKVIEAEELVIKRTDRAKSEAAKFLGDLAGVDRHKLTPEEESRAAVIRSSIRDDAATLSLGEVEREFRAAIVAGDRAALSVWAKAARARATIEEGKGEKGTGPIRRLVSQASEMLSDPAFEDVRREVRDLAGDASQIASRVRKARQRRSGVPQFGRNDVIVPFFPEERDPDSLGYD